MKYIAAIAAAALALSVPEASATDNDFEFWLNPSVKTDLDDDTALKLDTAQRWRSAGEGRLDTYFGRLWLEQQVSGRLRVMGGAEYRINDGGADETRFLQQMQSSHGILRTRFRLEQRFVEGADRMGLRLRPRLGINVPLDTRWDFKTDAELFVTLRGNNETSDTGVTGFRTQVGVGYELADNISLSLAYLRNESIRDARPNRVGHAPVIGIGYVF